MTIEIALVDAAGLHLARAQGEDEAVLVARHAYREGDAILLACSNVPCHVEVALDAGMAPARLFLTASPVLFRIPGADRRKAYSPQAFAGDLQRLSCRLLSPQEVAGRRNLALNPYDDHGITAVFPHAVANVETRGEAVFAARNAIDGEKAASDHGYWPFTSWGINRDPQASLTIEFGRRVRIDEAVFYLRADFPHDAWWEAASLTWSNGQRDQVSLKKTGSAQRFALPPREVDWVRLHSLIKADDPSPFPALTQLELWGCEV
ncbi:carbohydrate-binding protein [Xaviernesmea oryzae]|uniref:Carbohydrate-binding protein n=1 Tax=Xaviernesmea oryzae TaxID=464029 RepID=A0A1Q9AYT8_9HYPH|nr:carbohydrate-binding protein [Xaviernesmea oryzae]OLP60603.1 carbohydrate-binding protein [Xaviernesmea oryzae]SEM32847.1 hypothetical protein SAMN04487976_12913 [Xaviernesmea oryzae]